jgi:hypothetical protein
VRQILKHYCRVKGFELSKARWVVVDKTRCLLYPIMDGVISYWEKRSTVLRMVLLYHDIRKGFPHRLVVENESESRITQWRVFIKTTTPQIPQLQCRIGPDRRQPAFVERTSFNATVHAWLSDTAPRLDHLCSSHLVPAIFSWAFMDSGVLYYSTEEQLPIGGELRRNSWLNQGNCALKRSVALLIAPTFVMLPSSVSW